MKTAALRITVMKSRDPNLIFLHKIWQLNGRAHREFDQPAILYGMFDSEGNWQISSRSYCIDGFTLKDHK